MLSMSDMAADSLAIKSFALGSNWLCMFSANDMSPVISIRNEILSQLSDHISLEKLVAAFQSAFRKELVTRAECSILAPFGITMERFLQTGLSKLGSEIFSRLFYQIECLSLECVFLVHGFHDGEYHLFTIQNRGEVAYFDQPGFWAIGTGQTSALGSLFSFHGSLSVIFCSLEETLYLACKAKFNAESAPGVGKRTTALILYADGNRVIIHDDKLSELKKSWEATRISDVPPDAMHSAQEILGEVKALRKVVPDQLSAKRPEEK